MEQENLLDLFGITTEDFEKKASTRTKEKKEKTGTPKQKKGKNKDTYPLPAAIYGCGYCFTASDGGETRASRDRLKELLRGRFLGLDAFSFSLKEAENKEFVIVQSLREDDDKDKVIDEAAICYGDTELLFYGGTIADAKEAWCKEHPEFRGCLMAHNKEKQVLVPFFESNVIAGKRYDTPIQIGIMQHALLISKEEKQVSLETLKKRYLEEYPFYQGCSFFYSEEKSLLIPVMEEAGREKKTDIVNLPVTVRTALAEIKFDSEDFKGKSSASLEEIRMRLEESYPEYSRERTVMEYDKRHFIIPILKGSTKGAVFCSRSDEYALYMVEGCDGGTHRIEKTPVGEFAVCVSELSEKPEFHFALPKIPRRILNEAMHFFMENKEREAACQLFYTREDGYSIYYPEQRCTVTSVSFKRDYALECTKTLVMDMHSHGRIQAFFSGQDDRDEKGTRLFLVAGNLYDEPQVLVRAGITGRFVDLDIRDIFA